MRVYVTDSAVRQRCQREPETVTGLAETTWVMPRGEEPVRVMSQCARLVGRQPRREARVSRPARPTLADVAAQAGVSLKTASRALNAEYGVAATTAAAGAGRGPPARLPAQPLRSRSRLSPDHAAVGLVIPNLSDSFMAAVAAVGRGQPGSSRPATDLGQPRRRRLPPAPDHRAPSSSGGLTPSSSCPPRATRRTCSPRSTTGSLSSPWIVRWRA